MKTKMILKKGMVFLFASSNGSNRSVFLGSNGSFWVGRSIY